MKISLNWLRRYVDVSWDAEEIQRRLTLAGTEVDGVAHIAPGFTGVRVARVKSTRPHPSADRLKLALLDTGEGELEVVCGAPNCREGLTVAFAPVGAVLPGDFVIKKAKIRGEISLGMLCSEDELGLSDAAEGIMELSSDLQLGRPLEEALPIADTVLELGVTANRGDCLSHLGVARELAALAGLPLKMPEASLPLSDGPVIPVDIQAPDRCTRYVGRVVSGLRVAPSPFWMQRLLKAVGVRPINNLVDVTNFVLFEYGQPLHAFDLRDVAGPAITVRGARAGEVVKTLDGEDRALTPDDLLICDAARPVALAGIMGGENSEVKDDTVDVLLESAWFLPSGVRLTSRRLALRSESSQRFERSVDPLMTLDAANRALSLMCALSGPGSRPTVAREFTDAHPAPPVRAAVVYQPSSAEGLLGTRIDAASQRTALERLGFRVQGERDAWQVTPPSWRSDVSEAADLIEEVARFVGYDAIPTPPPRVTAVSTEATGMAKERRSRRLRAFLTSRGFSQALNYSFHSRELGAHFGHHGQLALANPLSEEQAVLRALLAPRLVESTAHNLRHGTPNVRLFEMGRVFEPSEAGLPVERDRLGLVWTGRAESHWSAADRDADFFDLSALVSDLARAMGRDAHVVGRDEASWLHPGATGAVVVGGAPAGLIGELHPTVARALDLGARVFVAELELAPFVEAAPAPIRFEDFGRFPAVTRDVALLLPKSLLIAQVLSSIKDLQVEAIDNVQVFDVYEGGSLGVDERSVGLRVRYRSAARTLTDDEVRAAHARVVEHLKDVFGVQPR